MKFKNGGKPEKKKKIPQRNSIGQNKTYGMQSATDLSVLLMFRVNTVKRRNLRK